MTGPRGQLGLEVVGFGEKRGEGREGELHGKGREKERFLRGFGFCMLSSWVFCFFGNADAAGRARATRAVGSLWRLRHVESIPTQPFKK